MKRLKREREKKIRVNITLDESVYVEYGLYIDNLSAFINKVLKNHIKKYKEQNVVSDNNLLCETTNEKRFTNQELIEIVKTPWINESFK